MRELYSIAVFLLVLGGFVLGAIGLFDYNLVAVMFGEGTLIFRSLYVLEGIAALYVVIDFLVNRERHMETPLRT
jgi:uncharacterized membrane protein YuzA (DUF378 family)